MCILKTMLEGQGTEFCQTLLQGADPAVKDAEGRTPLHHAVMRSHLAVVEALLESGGPVLLLSKDILGCTPVHLAAVQNQVGKIIRSSSEACRHLHNV